LSHKNYITSGKPASTLGTKEPILIPQKNPRNNPNPNGERNGKVVTRKLSNTVGIPKTTTIKSRTGFRNGDIERVVTKKIVIRKVTVTR
jgi:hypothetical protein